MSRSDATFFLVTGPDYGIAQTRPRGGPIGSGDEREGEATGTVRNDISSYHKSPTMRSMRGGKGRGKPISPRKNGSSNLE